MAIAYKLTNDKLQSRGGYQWAIGKWQETSGEGELCGPGWLHFYESQEMAALLGPIHSTTRTTLWCAEVDGEIKPDSCIKFGATKGRIIEKVELPTYTRNQRVAFAILCAYPWASTRWQEWADKWLDDFAKGEPNVGDEAMAKGVKENETEAEFQAALAAIYDPKMNRESGEFASAVAAARTATEAGTEWNEPGSASRSDTDEALYVLLCAEAAKDF